MGVNQQILLLSVASVVLLAAAIGIVLRFRATPPERERRRRLVVNRRGRMGDAILTDAEEGALYFTYSVRGVSYAASQDISALRHLVPERPASLVGPVTIKYCPKNPANSILLCEEWSGLRLRQTVSNQAPEDSPDSSTDPRSGSRPE